jgi:replicative DNA helicase
MFANTRLVCRWRLKPPATEIAKPTKGAVFDQDEPRFKRKSDGASPFSGLPVATVSLGFEPQADFERQTPDWDEITSIEPDGEEEVYDLTVPGNHNFVADNVVVHNSIEQDADVVMFLYRDVVYNQATEFPNQADVIVAKHRNGRTETISLYFDGSLTKFMDGAVRRISLNEDR